LLFNSIEFAIFLPSVFLIYWFVFKNSLGNQNIFLTGASYVFYGWWDWRFLLLILSSSIVDFVLGQKLMEQKDESKRKYLLTISLCFNLGLLFIFKYFNFFIDSFVELSEFLGLQANEFSLKLILPVGISFYTFQTLSYTIDVYRKDVKATNNLFAFLAYVSFFPQLVAGPIERSKNLLPQFLNKRKFDSAKAGDGLRQILWGLLKKVVIADNCALTVNQIFSDYSSLSASTLLLGAILFAFQIYGDFSGYSDIAIGTGRLFGINLMKNFSFPYFSRDIAEFWRRWHISLSSWFKDYVYIPLGGSRDSRIKTVRNVFIIFLVSGLWHGANWTFVIWGLLNAIYFLPLLLLEKNRVNTNVIAEGKILPNLRELSQVLITFLLTCFAWIFFRAETVVDALLYCKRTFNLSLFSVPEVLPLLTLILLIAFTIVEWIHRHLEYGLQLNAFRISRPWRWTIYYAVIMTIFTFGNFDSNFEFIYFQF